jgi:hypothetical protein
MATRAPANKCWGHDKPSDHSFCGLECIQLYEARQGIQLPAETREQLITLHGGSIPQVPTAQPELEADRPSRIPTSSNTLVEDDDNECTHCATSYKPVQKTVVDGNILVIFTMLNGARIVVQVADDREASKIVDDYIKKEPLWINLT